MSYSHGIKLEKRPNGLRLIPESPADLTDLDTIEDALEEATANGWEWVGPEECGSLTSGGILTDDAERDDQGTLIHLGRVYWDSEYAIRDTLEVLKLGQAVTWVAAD